MLTTHFQAILIQTLLIGAIIIIDVAAAVFLIRWARRKAIELSDDEDDEEAGRHWCRYD